MATAHHIHLIFELYKRIQRQKFFTQAKLDTLSALGEFAIAHFGPESVESMCAILLDGEMRLIEAVTLSRGSKCQAAFDATLLARIAVLKNASNVCLVHNHPGGAAIPDIDDKAITANANRTLKSIGITLTEHLVVNEIAYTPTMLNRLSANAEVQSSSTDIKFFNHFYQN
jgi:DNA repair protein RadC